MEAANIYEHQEKILSAISAKRWTQLDEIWLEVVAADPAPLNFHKPIIDKLLRKQQPQYFIKLYEVYLESLQEKGEHANSLALIEYIFTHEGSFFWVRPFLLSALEGLYAEDVGSQYESFLKRAGLNDEDLDPKEGLARFNDLLVARKGQVFLHRTWGLGVVTDLRMDEGKAVIDFDLKKGQVMTLEGVRNFLSSIPTDSLKARMALDPDGLRDECLYNPIEVLKRALNSHNGRIKVADLKRTLTTRFLKDTEYRKFWEGSRKAIKLDPWIDMQGTGVNAVLMLRRTPRSFFDEIIQNLVKATTPTQRREVLREVRHHGADADMTRENTEQLYKLFLKPLEDGILSSPAERFHHGLLFEEYQDLFERKENPVNLDELFASPDIVDYMCALEVPDSRRLAMERLFTARPDDWPEIFAEITISLDPRTAAWMEKEMKARDHDHERQIALESIVAKPDANPDLFVWAAKNLLEGNWRKLSESLPPIMICEELLSLLAELGEMFEDSNAEVANRARSSANKVRLVLSDGNCKYFKKSVSSCTVEEARRVLQSIRLHDAISHQLKHSLELILIDQFEELRTISRSDEEEEKKKPSYHYTTRDSLDVKRAELSKLVSVEIPGMAKVIEAAREHGDLRENAEYHAAKDRQKLLAQQAAELEDLIARARVVEAREIEPDTTRFGTKITVRDVQTGEQRGITLMGMWEADLENGIISYLTPFGSQLLGRKLGEKFSVLTPDGKQTEYEVTEISVALQPKAAHH